MGDINFNSLFLDILGGDLQDLEGIFHSDNSPVEMKLPDNDLTTSSPAPRSTILVESVNLAEYKTNAPELEHYLKQATPLEETRPKRKCSFSQHKIKNNVIKKSKNEECDRSEDEIKKTTETADNTSHKKSTKWSNCKSEDWWKLYDSSLTKTETPSLLVTCDKGFSFSSAENVFICQKKNHFQLTVVLDVPNAQRFIKVKDVYQSITSFQVHIYAVKEESPHQIINVEQSLTNRRKHPYSPVKFPAIGCSTKALTIGRLHFSETTSNNMRKKGKLNPDQRYFVIVVDIHAQTKQGNYSVCCQASEKLIVRASNPAQFENYGALWSKDKSGDSVYRMGNVGINNFMPEERLSVNGNLRLTGHVMLPSDKRMMNSIQETEIRQHIENICKMKLYKYRLNQDYAGYAGLAHQQGEILGVLAQELKTLIPDAVTEESGITLRNGEVVKDLLLVNQNRLLMESVGALQGLFQNMKIMNRRLVELEERNEIVQVVLMNAFPQPTDKEKCT